MTIEQYCSTRQRVEPLPSAFGAFESLCYAPFVSLFLDPLGHVRGCCRSLTHSLGSVREASLSSIWHGEATRAFRNRLRKGEFPSGCETCRYEVETKNFDDVFARKFDLFDVGSAEPEWPKLMFFALSNACNLECVQCCGEASSAIRKNRDRLPALPRAYDEAFFEELRLFLPHLTDAAFLGGEAFLARENFRIWEMMIQDGLQPSSFIITNGTIFDSRIERVLETLPASISVSLDGASKQTVESIRKNANFDLILKNVERFRQFTTKHGTRLVLSICVMPQNHHELADFLLLAEQLDCDVDVNAVYQPPAFSLSALSDEALRDVIAGWERRDAEMRRALDRNLGAWEHELDRARNWLEHRCHAIRPPDDLIRLP